jgi:hypothetical protein
MSKSLHSVRRKNQSLLLEDEIPTAALLGSLPAGRQEFEFDILLRKASKMLISLTCRLIQ